MDTTATTRKGLPFRDDRAAADLHRDRYAGQNEAGLLPDNEVIRTLLAHRSIRNYGPEPVPDEVVAAMAAAAQSAATSSNLQLWTMICVREPDLKSRLSVLAGDQLHIHEAPLLVVWLADLSRARAAADAEGTGAVGLDYLEMFLTAAIDASLAAQNAVAAAESLGYGTCYIGSMRNHPLEVARELSLPPEVFALFGLTVGLPVAGSGAEIRPRLAREAVVHEERYDASQRGSHLAAYNEAMSAFQASQKMPPVAWTRRVADRIGSASSLKGRDKLKGQLEALGFPLR